MREGWRGQGHSLQPATKTVSPHSAPQHTDTGNTCLHPPHQPTSPPALPAEPATGTAPRGPAPPPGAPSSGGCCRGRAGGRAAGGGGGQQQGTGQDDGWVIRCVPAGTNTDRPAEETGERRWRKQSQCCTAAALLHLPLPVPPPLPLPPPPHVLLHLSRAMVAAGPSCSSQPCTRKVGCEDPSASASAACPSGMPEAGGAGAGRRPSCS